MLDRIDFDVHKLSKEDYKPIHDQLIRKLIVLQQQAHLAEIGLVVLFEGWNGAGKGSRISDLMYNLDARTTTVSVTEDLDLESADMFEGLDKGVYGYFPLMQEFWHALGPRGNITFFDRGWYTKATQQMLFTLLGKDIGKKKTDISDKKIKKLQTLMQDRLVSVREFERQLTDDGYMVVKFFLHISQEEQRRRLTKLYENPATNWRVSKEKLQRVDNYEQAYRIYEDLLVGTDFGFSPWVVVNGEDKKRANLDIAATLIEALDTALTKKNEQENEAVDQAPVARAPATLIGIDPHDRSEEVDQAIRVEAELEAFQSALLAPKKSRFEQGGQVPSLDSVDRSLRLSRNEYKERLKVEQRRLYELELEMYLSRIPLLIMFEGWDAAGKGGAIKRVAQALDARSYTVFPSPAPTAFEKLHPHLWRYWTRLPKAGHVGIYDRSWYGRVLVERVEGFASDSEWARAYDEINGFEQDLNRWGAILVKFWVEVSREEQFNRFKARECDPNKKWKITDEDWRNRDKYPQYKAAVEDMFRLTSTVNAPWTILESEDKYYARVKALQIINDALEARLRES